MVMAQNKHAKGASNTANLGVQVCEPCPSKFSGNILGFPIHDVKHNFSQIGHELAEVHPQQDNLALFASAIQLLQ